MPANLYLQQFGDLLFSAFGEVAYHVGSSLTGATWRDVDVRIMLEPGKYEAMELGDPKRPQDNAKWCAFAMAFSALGQQMTGLPIDFQIQQRDVANEEYGGRKEGHARSALIMVRIRNQQ